MTWSLPGRTANPGSTYLVHFHWGSSRCFASPSTSLAELTPETQTSFLLSGFLPSSQSGPSVFATLTQSIKSPANCGRQLPPHFLGSLFCFSWLAQTNLAPNAISKESFHWCFQHRRLQHFHHCSSFLVATRKTDHFRCQKSLKTVFFHFDPRYRYLVWITCF